MNPHSIRQKLVLSMVGSLVLILGSMGIWALMVTHHEAEEIFSARLATSARVLEGLVAKSLESAALQKPLVIELPKELEQNPTDRPQSFGHSYESKIAFQVWHSGGPLLAHSATAPKDRLGPLQEGFHEHLADGSVWQVFALRSGQVWILVAEKEEVRTEMTEDLAKSIFTPLLIGALVLLVISQLVAWYSLRPLGTLAQLLAQRDAHALTPVVLQNPAQELVPVVSELNQLLARVRQAVEREQEFMDAAAHELRTPIAAIQVHLQNAQAASSPAAQQASIELALTGVRRATQMAEQLLAFSRITAQAPSEESTIVDLADLCIEAIAIHEPLISSKGQSIGFETPGGQCIVKAHAQQLHRMLQNLMDNASKYGGPQSEITVQLKKQATWAHLVVSNTGPTIPEADKARVFDPYFRGLGSGHEGSGLGLAIVQEIVQRHGGSIRVEDLPAAGGTRFVIELPLSVA